MISPASLQFWLLFLFGLVAGSQQYRLSFVFAYEQEYCRPRRKPTNSQVLLRLNFHWNKKNVICVCVGTRRGLGMHRIFATTNKNKRMNRVGVLVCFTFAINYRRQNACSITISNETYVGLLASVFVFVILYYYWVLFWMRFLVFFIRIKFTGLIHNECE